MQPKTIKTAYWISTILFALMMFMDGIGGVTLQQEGIDVMIHLHYPIYIMTLLGILKILGVVAILQTRFYAVKEWAYAGFAFNFIGAFFSRFAAGDGGFELFGPVIALVIFSVPYFFWKKYELLKKQ
jgi:DoxX-like family